MDTKIIQQYGTEILCYRIHTARHKKRMQYKDFDKQLIKIHKEEKDLYQKRRNLDWEPLIPPVQKGWKRFFVLREDVAKSMHKVFYENILSKINTSDWSHRKDFKVKKRRRGRKTYVVKGQKLLEPDEYHFQKLGFSDVEKQFFHVEYHFEEWNRQLGKKYVFNEPWRFVLRVRPNMIDKIQKRDDEIESRLQKIDNYLERNDYRKRQTKLLYGSYRYYAWKKYEKYNEKNPLRGKSIQQIIEELISEH